MKKEHVAPLAGAAAAFAWWRGAVTALHAAWNVAPPPSVLTRLSLLPFPMVLQGVALLPFIDEERLVDATNALLDQLSPEETFRWVDADTNP